MNEEEIIKNVKRIIKYKVISNYINDNDSRAIQGLLDLYQKEKEKNKKAIKYILKKQSLQYKYALSKIECEELLELLEERN